MIVKHRFNPHVALFTAGGDVQRENEKFFKE
jgi:hypothetical protein